MSAAEALAPEQSASEVRESLSVTEKGQPANTIGNCRTVFCHDPLLRGAIRLNLLTDRVDIVRDLGWRRNTSALTDTDVKYLLLYFEQNYGLTSEKKMTAALSIVANENCYHPIQDVLNGLISFMTNTNLQHYSGESGLSYVAQMCVIIFMMFTSAATGYAACMAFCRGLAGKKIGNFYEDMVRITTRILIPASFIVGLLLVSQGTPQTLQGNFTIETLEGNFQDIAVGPVAALESIKHLGTNGGGFFGANSTTPFENPTVISNIIEMISMMLLPGACVVTFGHMLHDKRKEKKAEKVAMNAQVLPGTAQKKVIFGRQGAVVFGAMAIIFLIGLTICYQSEMAGNPVIQEMGIDQSQGSMEGKEVRFGVPQSALFTTVTTSFTTGTVNNMHDTLTPL